LFTKVRISPFIFQHSGLGDDDGHESHDNRDDNGIGSEDDEDNGSNCKASLSDGNDGVNEDEDRDEIMIEEEDSEGSALTEIDWSSDVQVSETVKVVPGRRK
jgi:hypothetical protein